MKKTVFLFALIVALGTNRIVISQTLQPVIFFDEDPITHNMHICSDGEFYYTINGGNPSDGQISKYSVSGSLIGQYPIELDMRSIFYNKKDKHFYVNCYDGVIYKVIDLENGVFKTAYENLYSNDQACLALSTNGKLLYEFDDGTLKVYNFKNGELVNTIKGLKHGTGFAEGSTALAVSKKNVYTWDGFNQEVYVYNKNGQFIKTAKIDKGNYGFSLSYANGLLFVSEDGNYSTGTWYGYDI